MTLFPRRKKHSDRVATLVPMVGSKSTEWRFRAPPTRLTPSGKPTNGSVLFLTDQASRRSLRAVRRDYVNAMAVDVDDNESDDDGDEAEE